MFQSNSSPNSPAAHSGQDSAACRPHQTHCATAPQHPLAPQTTGHHPCPGCTAHGPWLLSLAQQFTSNHNMINSMTDLPLNMHSRLCVTSFSKYRMHRMASSSFHHVTPGKYITTCKPYAWAAQATATFEYEKVDNSLSLHFDAYFGIVIVVTKVFLQHQFVPAFSQAKSSATNAPVRWYPRVHRILRSKLHKDCNSITAKHLWTLQHSIAKQH